MASLEAFEPTKDLTCGERASGVAYDDVEEPRANTTPITIQPGTRRIETANSASLSTPGVGGLRGFNEDIRRFSRMTCALVSSMPGYEMADGWDAMLPAGRLSPWSYSCSVAAI